MARQFVITFAVCEPAEGRTCKSEEEIKEWMATKQIWFMYNKFSF